LDLLGYLVERFVGQDEKSGNGVWFWKNVLLGNGLAVEMEYNRRSPAGAGLFVRGGLIVEWGNVGDYRRKMEIVQPRRRQTLNKSPSRTFSRPLCLGVKWIVNL
jgi:hypothetical protein